MAERCVHDHTSFLISVRPLTHVGVQRDGRRGMAQCELDPLDACALVETDSEVVAETMQAHAFGNPANAVELVVAVRAVRRLAAGPALPGGP